MKTRLSTAHLLVVALICAAAFLGFYLLVRSADPTLEHPGALVVPAVALLLILQLEMKRFPLRVELADQPLAEEQRRVKNPLLLLGILLTYPKATRRVLTLSGAFFVEEDVASGQAKVVQAGEPTATARLADLLLLAVGLLGFTIIFVFGLLTGDPPVQKALVLAGFGIVAFSERPLKRWCLSNVAHEAAGVLVSPLLLTEGRAVLGTVAQGGRRALISPRVLSFNERVRSYVIAHEQGHVRFKHLRKVWLREAAVLMCFLIWCLLLAKSQPFASLALVPAFASLLWGMWFVSKSEAQADEYAAEQIGPETCIWALRWLRDTEGPTGEWLSRDSSSFFATFLRYFNLLRGRVSIEKRIHYIECLYDRESFLRPNVTE